MAKDGLVRRRYLLKLARDFYRGPVSERNTGGAKRKKSYPQRNADPFTPCMKLNTLLVIQLWQHDTGDAEATNIKGCGLELIPEHSLCYWLCVCELGSSSSSWLTLPACIPVTFRWSNWVEWEAYSVGLLSCVLKLLHLNVVWLQDNSIRSLCHVLCILHSNTAYTD